MAITLNGTSGITLGANSALAFGDASTLPSATFQSIYPVSATVSANDLIVTLNPCAIAFRSATLTSGTTSTVAVPSAITVTVPNGATLGSVNNVQSDVMVVAINNSGTAELAVVIGAGDESGVISTIAMSTASDTIGTYYSTTARSNVPYCVVGFIRSTQVTAGTWNTAPSLVQGYRVAPSGLGYGQTWQSVTRSNGTTYYNTTGKPIQLIANFTSTSNVCSVTVTVSGVAVYTSGLTGGSNYSSAATQIIIPPGSSYVVSLSGTTNSYVAFELR